MKVKKNNSYNLCLSLQWVNFIILQGKLSLEKSGGRVVLVSERCCEIQSTLNLRGDLRGMFYFFGEVVEVKPKLFLLVYFWI